MTWPFGQRDLSGVQELLALRTGDRSRNVRRTISRDHALRHSAVWACLRLRADLISTMPVDVFRMVGGIQVETPKPPVLVSPGGSRMSWMEFAYSTQVDLDSTGNTVGLITARDGLGLPAVIELQNIDEVSFIGKGPRLTKVRVGQSEYDPAEIWHEKQYTISGLPIGLSPIAHAALSIRSYLSAQEFAQDWFNNSTVPGGHLKNSDKTLRETEARRVKEDFKASVAAGDVWVSGKDWTYDMLSAKASESGFLEERQFSIADVCRFLGVPGDMIDAETSTGSITYANITQRNLQLLIMHLGPAIRRREDAISRGLLPQPRFAKLNRGALLEMDLKSRYEAHGMAIEKRFKAPSEVRADENLPPFTPEQEAEFARLFPNKATQPVAAPGGVTP